MSLIDARTRALLIANGQRNQRLKGTRGELDFKPAVKLFLPDGAATWLLSEIDPSDHDLAFALCDFGLGFPELGSVRLSELTAVRGRLGLAVERDRHFRAEHTLAEYAELAQAAGRIIA